MTGISGIRAATDFSAQADNAALRAAGVGAGLGLEQGLLVHALRASRLDSLRQSLSGGRELLGSLEQHARTELEQRSEQLHEQTGFLLAPRLVREHLLDGLLDGISAGELTVVGGGGSGTVRELALGSTAEAVVRASRQPVLIARRPAASPWKRVMVAVDFSVHSPAAVSLARELAPEAELTLIHACEPLPGAAEGFTGIRDADVRAWREGVERDVQERLGALLRQCSLSREQTDFIMEYAYPPALVAARAREYQADLVVVGKQGHSRFREWLLGSVTTHVMRRLDMDVAVATGA